jgi:lipoic acid synthetase
VLTSVSRDDLPDGGSEHYARTIEAIRKDCVGVGVEVLIPDYLGDALSTVVEAAPEVLAHNVEVVRELTSRVRDRRCSYSRSLEVLAEAKQRQPSLSTKSSILLGLGETDEQVERCLDDLRGVGVDIVCIGQYLQPTRHHAAVTRYVTPERFAELGELARSKGFAGVASAPLVRTSYHAADYAGSRPT